MENENKQRNVNWTAISIVGIIAAGVVGLMYTSAITEKTALERQKNESAERLRAEELRLEQAKADQKSELDKKEFAAKMKTDCLGIYKNESAKWNNVRGWRYDETENRCYIRYSESTPKPASKCDSMFPLKDDKGTSLIWNIHDNLMCKEGEFENGF